MNNEDQISTFVIDGMGSPIVTREGCSIHFDGCCKDVNSPLKDLLRCDIDDFSILVISEKVLPLPS